LHPNITEAQLKALCASYGVITSVKINMLDNFKFDGDSPVNEKISTGIGFVNFEAAESAAKAQNELNRKEIEGKVVFVSHWVPKEELLRKFKVPHLRNKMMMNEFPQMFPTRMPMMGGPPMGGRPNRPMQTDPRKRGGPPHYPGAQPPIQNARPAPQNSQAPKLIPVSSTPASAPVISVSKLQEIIDKLPDLRTKKQTLGEFIYPRIMALTNQTIAGKVTGMLLEMEIPALIKFGEDVGLLRTRVGEALEVLRKAWTADENQRQYLPLLTLKDA
jgi:polyadenylate-binding protein